ncbi:hypothetical protein A2U10_05585 [Fusobacterium necrophorum subsp. funduliforme]|uniref:Membrane protein, PF10097 family n=3 Tax=Fusobacterium necrophorum TaxID=859 RepID=A0AAN4ARV7_9FUSO|nr:DUF2335 domain-containing protein [Fusobacterium necrophorum]AYV94807.1 DUF2335 domain-containing protein [Fusobacterium necrophorum subsp. funduliforme]EFS23242.1 hypothetical protein FSEG_00849 [Fusobacterium necrophorum D12]EJU15261.1 membrane protein, PF10097 family [Fusobacterium necrophorum subsp. funduliforme Fnf 1007]KDE63442.1 membrane protein [Fusobacterium necrophorum DJ-1]KDE67222.1 membrane protein [Fusobacterium necrophorum DAB]
MTRKVKNPISKDSKQQEFVLSKQQIHHYSGIIPHPDIIEGYERNCPGATDRILAMTEDELKHKQELERIEQENINECRLRMLDTELKNSRFGQIFGFILLFTMIIGGFILVYSGRSVGGYSTIVSSIVISLGAVLYNNFNKNSKK